MKRLTCIVLAGCAAFAHSTLLTSDTFESPTHVVGNTLDTSATANWTSYVGFLIDNVTPFAGTQCVKIDATNDSGVGAAFAYQYLTVDPNSGTERIVRTKTAARWDHTSSVPTDWTSVGLVAANGNEYQGAFRFFTDNGSVEMDGWTAVGQVGATLRDKVAEHAWVNMELRLDYRTQTVNGYLNGKNVGAAFNFTGTGFTDGDLIQDVNSANLPAVARFDNYSVETAAGAQVTGTAAIGGITNPLGSWVTLDFYSGTTLVDSVTGIMGASGEFDVSPIVADGTYSILARGYTTVTKKLTGTISGGVLAGLNFGTLINGDINGDNQVNLLDFSLLSSAYGSSLDGDPGTAGNQPTAGWNPWADLNQDGTVNLLDFSLLSSNYGSAGATP